jgi:parallel beta-helix repeat protein
MLKKNENYSSKLKKMETRKNKINKRFIILLVWLSFALILLVVLNMGMVSADQSISSCQYLSTPNENYSLSAPISFSAETCIVITAENITLDCKGYTITSNTLSTVADRAYLIKSTSNFTTVKNCRLSYPVNNAVYSVQNYPIYYSSSHNGLILNNTITIPYTFTYGIYLNYSSNNTVANNSIAENGYTIYSLNSNNNRIINNSVTGDGYGIQLYSSSNNTISFNRLITTGYTSTYYGLYASASHDNEIKNNTILRNSGYGIYLVSSLNNNLTNNQVNTSSSNSYMIFMAPEDYTPYSIDSSNLAEGKPVNYTYNAENLIFEGINSEQYGQVIFVLSRNITIKNSNFSRDSLNLFYTSNSTIENCQINTNNGWGVYLYNDSNIYINNSIIISKNYGLYLYNNSFDIINNNTIVTTVSTGTAVAYGVYMDNSPNNSNINNNLSVSGGIAFNTGVRIFNSNGTVNLNNIIASSDYGIWLQSSANINNINNIINSETGISLRAYATDTNNINNTIVCAYGIYSYSGVYNNYKINNINNTINGSVYGIFLYGQNNVNTNNVINSGFYGIFLNGLSSWCNNSDNTVTTNSGPGVQLSGCSSGIIINNTITTNGSTGYGVYLENSQRVNLSRNYVNTSKTNSYVIYGTGSTSYNHTIDSTNFAEGKPVNYTYNAENLTFEGVDFTQYGQVIFSWCRNITITNSNFSKDSLNLFGTDNSKISDNFVNTSTGYGIWNSYSNKNKINNNRVATFGDYLKGIWLYQSSSNNSLNNNTVITLGDSAMGIRIESPGYNNVTNNIISTNGTYSHGLYSQQSLYGYTANNVINTLGGSSYGVYMYAGYYGIIVNNTATNSGNNSQGFFLDAINHYILINNTAIMSGNNSDGIYFSQYSHNNTFLGMNVYTSGTNSYAFHLGPQNYTFSISDSILNASNPETREFYIDEEVTSPYRNKGIWNFTNVTRADENPITINWSEGINGTLNMHWYLDVNVRAGTTSLQNVNVTYYNKFSNITSSKLTGSNGKSRTALLEYKRNETSGTNYTYYSLYNMTVIKSGYSSYYNSSINMSGNLFMDIDLGCACPVGGNWIASVNCTLIDSMCNMPSYKVICTSGSLTMSNYTIIADKIITPIGHGCLILDNRSRVVIGR